MSSPYLLTVDQFHLMKEHGIIPRDVLVELLEGQLYRVPTDDAEHQYSVQKAFDAISRALQKNSSEDE